MRSPLLNLSYIISTPLCMPVTLHTGNRLENSAQKQPYYNNFIGTMIYHSSATADIFSLHVSEIVKNE